jgi:L-seryl-tRNA(Ser) seleniumtransferase
VVAALARTPDELLRRARRLAAGLADVVPASAEPSAAAVGGGGAPGVVLESAAVVLPSWLAQPLRTGELPVVGRVERDRLLLDLAAVDPSQDDALADAVRRAAG